MKYTDLNLKTIAETRQIQSKSIHVLQYLPVQDKIDLIQIALQKSEQGGIYNEMKLNLHFYLNIIYLYTDLEFAPEDREDENKLFDELESNGIIQEVIAAIPENEMDTLMDSLEIMKQANVDYKNSISALFQTLIQDLPRQAATAAEIVQNFNPEKYAQVVEFAKAANGGRPIPTLVEP